MNRWKIILSYELGQKSSANSDFIEILLFSEVSE